MNELAVQFDSGLNVYALVRRSDGKVWNPMPAPINTVATAGLTTGGVLANATTYAYKVTATNANGETLPSGEFSVAIAGPLSTPAAPAIGNVGTAGATTYYYQIIAKNAIGTTAGYTGTPPGSGVGSTATGNATLNGTNYNTVTWSAITGATSYDVLKWTGAAWALLVNTTALTINDQGGSTSGYTVPSSNTSATSTNKVNLVWDKVQGGTGYKVYGRTVAAELLIATLGDVGAYTDDGSVTPSGALPTANTANGYETYAAANLPSYPILMPEDPGACGYYRGDATAAIRQADEYRFCYRYKQPLQTNAIANDPRIAQPERYVKGGSLSVDEGLAQAGSSSTITLALTAPNGADQFRGCVVAIVAGTGIGQVRTITAYSTGRVATVDDNWTIAPDATSAYQVLKFRAPKLDSGLKITNVDVDGITDASYREFVLAVLGGVAAVSGNVVQFMKRDGTTVKATITYGAVAAQRNLSAINS